MTQPSREELLARAEKYIGMTPPDGRGTALLVMELADALRSSTQAPQPEKRQQSEMARAILTNRGIFKTSIDQIEEYQGETWINALDFSDELLALAVSPTHQREDGK